MNAAYPETASPPPALDDERIDLTRPFIPEAFTPLFHTREYRRLPEAVRLRYNQLHALYFNEQVAFFEQEMLSPALLALQRSNLPAGLTEKLKIFFDEEQQHTAMFRALNRRCAPEMYGTSAYYFVRVARPWRSLLGEISRRPRLFPLLAWLALIQEERSVYYSKGCLEQGRELEPHFVAAHRSHLADEVGHVRCDEQLLDWLWPRTHRVVRLVNVRLLSWMIGEFFLLPKRSGRRVVEQLSREFPQLDAGALRRAMDGLETNTAYLRTLYSREVLPRSFARFDASRELAPLARALGGLGSGVFHS